MNILPFQIDNFRIPVLNGNPILEFSQGQSVVEHALKNFGKRLSGRSRVSTRTFALNSVFLKLNGCYDSCNQLSITEFQNAIDGIVDKEVTMLFISQDNRIYSAQCDLKYPIYNHLDSDQYSWSTQVTIIGEISEVTNDLWIDTEHNEFLCSDWIRAKDLKYYDIENNCDVFKVFFRPDFVPEYPEYFPNVRSSLVFNNGQLVVNNGQAMVYTGGFVNPYPEIDTNDYSVKVAGNTQVEFYYFFVQPPPVNITIRRLYINSVCIEIPLTATMLAIANGKIYVGTKFTGLREIKSFNNNFYNETASISYQNNLNTKDYYAYYKLINQII
jgi:hypothetical protein